MRKLPNRYGPGTKVSVGTSAVLASAHKAQKLTTLIQADKANAQLIYVGGTSAVTTAAGFGELAAGESLTLEGAAAVYVIAGGASQNVRVLEGFN